MSENKNNSSTSNESGNNESNQLPNWAESLTTGNVSEMRPARRGFSKEEIRNPFPKPNND